MLVTPRLLPALLAGVLAVSSCTGSDETPVTVQPGAPGEPGRVIDGAPEQAHQPHTETDVRFMHAMIAHHAQALRMTALVPDRAQRHDIALLANRIEVSQEDEIAMMEGWLEARNEPGAGAAHQHDVGGHMPGMLTEQQFTELAAANGAEFDRRFLELMINHHEGALIMVTELYDSGGGQEAEIFELATHIDADQRIELDRMHRLLAEFDQ